MPGLSFAVSRVEQFARGFQLSSEIFELLAAFSHAEWRLPDRVPFRCHFFRHAGQFAFELFIGGLGVDAPLRDLFQLAAGFERLWQTFALCFLLELARELAQFL